MKTFFFGNAAAIHPVYRPHSPVLLGVSKRTRFPVPEAQATVDSRQAAIYGGLFCLAVAMVLRLVPLCPWFDGHCSGALVSGPARIKNRGLGTAGHLRRFFSPFPATLPRMEAVHILFARLLSHGTMLISALTCQIISNVPAAILLSRFTQDACGLLVGVNVGGAGTLVASLASLITFREYTRRVPNGGKRFFSFFLGSALHSWQFFWLPCPL